MTNFFKYCRIQKSKMKGNKTLKKNLLKIKNIILIEKNSISYILIAILFSIIKAFIPVHVDYCLV